ncbi:hypothetical protein [Chroococcus sp. FPU101]|uniref:hypothetical protein n=1 Tax=Chroococcus sp. FPU101 TaxID=1974212 RepID=UPI001A8CA72E|nr:hypothetical protein [Chroococcus sp. FPU101]GFE67790.1 hypothetical protein CFPU101_04000 [Chroococcus sp. FPU101]
MPESVAKVCTNLETIDQVDLVTGAIYRQEAQEILATPTVALTDRTAVADSLVTANQLLSSKTVLKDDSY